MKKVLFSVLCVCISLASVCQLKNTEIAEIILKSKEANISNGVFDPNKIYAGQNLTFLFQNGLEKTITVEKGDSQWKILKEKIAALVIKNGDIVDYPKNPTPDPQPQTPTTPAPQIIALNDGSTSSLPWIFPLLVILLVSFVVYNLWKRRKEAKKDPVTSGPAMRPGGITDENALAYANQVANRQFNNPNLVVREVQRGMLSGENLEVFYAGNSTPQRRTFTNRDAYRGVVNLNGADQFVYFLQGCGNDVRMGNYFTGQNIQFIVNAEAPVLRPQPVATVATEDIPEVTSQIVVLVTAMTKVLESKKSGKMVITGNAGLKLELFFSDGPIGFSENGQIKNLPATTKEGTLQQH